MSTEATTPETEGKQPHELFAEQTARTNDLLAELIADRKASKSTPAKAEDTEPSYSQEQLQALVDDGKITVGQMVQQLVYQGAKAVAKATREENERALARERTRGSTDQRLAAYRASFPDLANPKSATAKKVAKAIAELAEEDGLDPESARTELMACRMVLGEGKKPARETTGDRVNSVEGTGGRADVSRERASGGKFPDWMPDAHVAFYEKQIAAGRYRGEEGEKALKREFENLKSKLQRKGQAA